MTGMLKELVTIVVVLLAQSVCGQQTLENDRVCLSLFLTKTLPDVTGYNFTDTPCKWIGISCNSNRVWKVDLPSSGLNGSIPAGSLGSLDALHYLNLFNNSLGGPLPYDLWNLTQLTQLNLSSNMFNESLPKRLGNLAGLQALDLSLNLFAGSIPDTIGNLTSLRTLNFSHNSFGSSIPAELFNCTGLRTIDLSANALSGEVPSGVGKLPYIEALNLSVNLFEGNIAPEIFNSTSLNLLDISYCKLTGPIPIEITKLSRLRILRLANNSLIGSIPEKMQYMTQFTEIDLSKNGLVGGIPPLNNLRQLQSLSLSNNQLNGSFPSGTFGLPALQYLHLGNNLLVGDLEEPRSDSVLKFIDLHGNFINSSIPDTLLSLKNLTVLNLGNNRFFGFIPQNVSSKLTLLDLHGNYLEGVIPDSIGTTISLECLDLSSNPFSSHPFPRIFDLTQLLTLNLSFSNVEGNIPDKIGNLSNLLHLDLSHNSLNASIPSSLQTMQFLLSLDLSDNNLGGPIPIELSSMTFLIFLNVSYNNLSGEVPVANQWETFPKDSFLGNPGLCGMILNRACSTTSSTIAQSPAGYRNQYSFSSSHAGMIAGIVVGSAVAVIIAFAVVMGCQIAKAMKPVLKDEVGHVSGPMLYEKDAETWATGIKDPSSIPVTMFEKPLLSLTFADLLHATGNFSMDMQIADGGYGPVYRGNLPDGTQVAIKVLVEVGLSKESEAAARIEELAKVRHPNLVPLLGYCLVGEDSILLYHFMVNGDLQQWLHDLPAGTHNTEDWSLDTWEHLEGDGIPGDHIGWAMRHKIALGAARALAFLHHGSAPPIIHRDVKSSNIVLDEECEAYLIDAGLAGIAKDIPVIGGTVGYVPPEYGQTWQATTRGDVYSFGVVLLELVTGRKPIGRYFPDSCGGNLVGWVRTLVREKREHKALDPKLVSQGPVLQMLETLRIGYLCTAESAAKRPTMQQVVGLLKDYGPEESSLH